MRCDSGEISAMLGVPILLAFAGEPIARHTLTADELIRYRSLGGSAARRHWLLGRAALKALLPGDTSTLVFPHRSMSLTHAGGRAVATRSTTQLAGIGVDYEPWRARVHARMAAFFLRPREQTVVESAAALVRLWTIKEALFKALPGNAGHVLLDFELIDPALTCGWARGPRGSILRYANLDTGPGSLSVAVNQGGDHVPV